MTNEHRRKLAAIFCADVAGYTKLMARAESATHASFKSCLNEVILPALETHRGHIVKNTGDGFIAIFESVVDSLACALAVQDGVAAKKECSRISFRIGINVGDIIAEDGDVFGDGVNVAARLQTLAVPGGVCVSALVRDQLRGKLEVEFESIGRRTVKKGEEPIDAYLARPPLAVSRRNRLARAIARLRPPARRTRVITLSAVAIIAVGLFVWRSNLPSMHRLAYQLVGEEASRFPLPDRPSLVVLPFKDFSSGKNQEYFADGITEDITTDLARLGGLFVIARTSSFAYKSRSDDVRKIGRDLGVRYALEGSVRHSDRTVRIDAQLVDTQSGGHIWAARFDKPLGDIFKIQDEITQKIVDALSIKISEREQTQPARKQTTSVAVYDAFLRGWAAYRHNTFDDYRKAIEYFKTAIALDPQFSQAHAAIAAAYLAMRKYSWTRVESFTSPVQIVLNAGRHDQELMEKAQEHLALAQRNPTSLAYRSSAEILIVDRKYDEAVGQIRKAIALNPNDADNYAVLSSVLVWAESPRQQSSRSSAQCVSIHILHRSISAITDRPCSHWDDITRRRRNLNVAKKAIRTICGRTSISSQSLGIWARTKRLPSSANAPRLCCSSRTARYSASKRSVTECATATKPTCLDF